MLFDPNNPVTQLCADGMQLDGEPAKALAKFEEAWALRRDDFDASVAAHFLARHQSTAHAALEWNEIALQHADKITDGRSMALLPSLCLNLADSYRIDARLDEAELLAERGLTALRQLPAHDGYAEFVRAGLERLLQRIRAAR